MYYTRIARTGTRSCEREWAVWPHHAHGTPRRPRTARPRGRGAASNMLALIPAPRFPEEAPFWQRERGVVICYHLLPPLPWRIHRSVSPPTLRDPRPYPTLSILR